MASNYHLENLFSPLKIRGVTIKNRILSTGHQTFLARDGKVTEELIAYHEARAQGGVGLIITESARFHISSINDSPEVHIHTDEAIAGYRQIVQRVHQHGTKIIGQLSHSGRCSQRRIDGVRGVVYAPSAIPDNRFHTMPRAMPEAMVAEIIESCGQAAGRMAEAGLDGVELLVSHGLLFAQFVNPMTNQRNDQYGGSFENRMRPLVQSLQHAREAFGEHRLVGIRISAEENEPDGMQSDLAAEVASYLAIHGLVDYINTTTGSMAGPGGSIHVAPPMEFSPGYVAQKAKSLRDACGIPVFVAGRINQPQEAEKIVATGMADMCGMTRALIADELLPIKAAEGRFDEIRACIACNQGCIGHFHQGYSITCIQHPVSGRETRLARPAVVDKTLSILVAGAGPAGLEAAITSAKRGHRVTLCESASRVGGQANLAAKLPDRMEFGGLVTNLESELSRTDVDLRCNTKVNRELVDQLKPDVLVIATGSRPYAPEVEGIESMHVINAHQFLAGKEQPGSRVLVVDWRCDWVGMGIAEQLALSGRQVRLAVNGTQAGQELQPYVRDHLVGKLHRAGVEVITYARLFGVDEDSAYLMHIITGDPIVCENVDSVVMAYGTQSNTQLEQSITSPELCVKIVGDCVSPRTAEEAILEGYRAAIEL